MIALIAGVLALAPCPPGTERVPIIQHTPGACAQPKVLHLCDRKCRTRRMMRRTVAPYRHKLQRMAWCESRGRWHIATGNGFYGGLQWVPSTWWSVGGKGMPHHASKLEQMFRAVRLIRSSGYHHWPVCQYA